MSTTHSRRHRHVCSDPLHVVAGPDGTILVFLPDGQSIALTVDAAARSTLLMARTVRRVHAAGAPASASTPPGAATIIPVDFAAVSRLH